MMLVVRLCTHTSVPRTTYLTQTSTTKKRGGLTRPSHFPTARALLPAYLSTYLYYTPIQPTYLFTNTHKYLRGSAQLSYEAIFYDIYVGRQMRSHARPFGTSNLSCLSGTRICWYYISISIYAYIHTYTHTYIANNYLTIGSNNKRTHYPPVSQEPHPTRRQGGLTHVCMHVYPYIQQQGVCAREREKQFRGVGKGGHKSQYTYLPT
ncbi:hypothetical protein F4779DRAFT_289339 [Xylariaceae sp. FL0662B]|nr:hypothetical protein F4779DRAFT_289339 [Xylariaceae sp. FL0662B]